MVTATEWLDLEPGTRSDTFRFDVLDVGLRRQGSIDVREDVVATVSNNIHQTIKRTATFAPKADELADLNLLRDRIRPMMILPSGDEYSLGVFGFADVSSLLWTYGEDSTVTLADQGMIVDQPVTQSYGVSAGSSAKTKIEELLASAGVPSFVVEVDATVQSPVAWPPGTSRQVIINELAGNAGGYSLFFDSDGVGRVIEVPPRDAPNLSYSIAARRIARGSIVRSDDSLDAPNRFIVIGQTGGQKDVAGDETAVGVHDIDDAAPHSAVNRGFVVAQVLTTAGVATSSDAEARARSWAKQSDSNLQWLSFISPLDPRHDTFDVVEVDVEDGDGVVVWREQGWTMELRSGGIMTHDLRRSYQ